MILKINDLRLSQHKALSVLFFLMNGILMINLCSRIGYGFQDVRSIKREEDECSSKMIMDMERLLESGTLTDVTIKCENRIIECHKAILSARSTVFRAMFQHDMRENKSNEINISVS